jgi:hypothetical protein
MPISMQVPAQVLVSEALRIADPLGKISTDSVFLAHERTKSQPFNGYLATPARTSQPLE